MKSSAVGPVETKGSGLQRRSPWAEVVWYGAGPVWVQTCAMAEPLKESFGPDVPVRLAKAIETVWPRFDTTAFLSDALEGYDELELTPRARHIAHALRAHLPDEFDHAIEVLLDSLGPPAEGEELKGMAPFFYAPHVFFVAEYGVDHWDSSIRAQYELTQRFTAEYSIRVFLESEPARTLTLLRDWARDPSPHVRRLVSEGTRPRLPWAPRLAGFQKDPSPVVVLLELLKDDPSLYVRRSVANNLNDIGKDHPAFLLTICRSWSEGADENRRLVIRHALRSAVKRGDREALDILGFGKAEAGKVDEVAIEPGRPRIGEAVRISVTVRNVGTRALFNVDLRVHFVKANGRTAPKVFKVRELELDQGERGNLSKRISLRQHTTRTHYSGEHPVEVVVNGKAHRVGSFQLVN
jgi:3-methyladenine DNA glycosylase AlkC